MLALPTLPTLPTASASRTPITMTQVRLTLADGTSRVLCEPTDDGEPLEYLFLMDALSDLQDGVARYEAFDRTFPGRTFDEVTRVELVPVPRVVTGTSRPVLAPAALARAA